MRTREHNWLDTNTLEPKYGFQVYANGCWCHVHEDGKPCIYDTPEERDAARAKARRMAARGESATGGME